jgi:glycosyltransferase involved in cell wall biosynthesis
VRIAYLAPGYAPVFGGIERHVEEIARRLAAAGHRVDVLTQAPGRAVARETIDGVEVHRFRAVNRSTAYGVPPGLFAYAARHLREYDIVHAHGYHALPSLAALLSGPAPVVFTPHYHGTGHTRFANLMHVPYRPLGHALFRRARAVVCVSGAERRLVVADVPRVAPRVEVIPNGVDIEAIEGAEPWPDAGLVVLSIGRLLAYKQVDRLISALPYAPAAARLVIVGAGPVEPELRQQVADAGLADRVAFAGRVDDAELRRWLRSATVVASLSREEAYGLVLAEGLAAGAAVVASGIDAHREVLERQPLGVLVPVDAEPRAIGAAIADAIGRRARPHDVSVVHGWDEVAARTLGVYERVRREAVQNYHAGASEE